MSTTWNELLGGDYDFPIGMYASKEDLARWLGYLDTNGNPDVSSLPGNVDKLLINASRLIDHATLNRIDQDNTDHMIIANRATTAQVEYWIDAVGEDIDVQPDIAGFSAGKTSVQYKNGIPKLSPRARRELWLGGLLNRTVIRI